MRPGINAFFKGALSYEEKLASQIDAVPTLQRPELGWSSIVHSEQRVISTLQYVEQSTANLTKGGDPEIGRNSLSQAIAQAHANGRLTLSDQGILQVENVLGEEAARPLRIPPGQRGFATAELLAGDLSAGQALRTAGLLATAADTVMTGQRATQLLGQDNPLAAQSELAHFAGRNIGGWAGGTAAAYALGSSGAGPMVLIAADAYFLSAAGEKAAALLDNRAIYTQTDLEGTQWSFDGRAWAREGKADTTNDGVDNPTATPIVASYQKARELNYQATNAAAALALRDAPAPQEPYRQPANATDRPSLSSAAWRRDAADGQWHRLVKAEISGANDRGSYVQETALPPRKAELDAQAQDVIARNIANSPGAIAARYELAHHRSGWAADGLPMSPAVQQALPDPDALTASDGQHYYRNMDGQWTSNGPPPDGNRVLELETTRAMLQPALAEHAQAIAAIRQSPPSVQDLQREETQYRYRIVGTELQPQWREAIELATQRTRATEGLTGDSAMQLQRGPGGQFGADSPIAHLQRGADGVDRIAAITSSEDIRQALQEVQAWQQSAAPIHQLASTSRPSGGSADSDTSGSNASSSPQLVMDMQVRMQAASAAQARQQREQQERQTQEQQLAQTRAHALQEQTSHEYRAQAAQALQAHAVQELRQQESQQLEQQERQTLEAQQREHVQRQAHDTQQREQAQQHTLETQQREQEKREAQDAQQSQQERLQAQTVQHPEQQPLHAQAALQREQEPAQEAVSREPSSLHAQDTSPRQPEQQSTQDGVAQRPQEQLAEPAQAQASDVAQKRTQSQQAQEERPHEAQQQTAQRAAIAQTAPADQQQVADLHSGQRSMTAQASDAHQDALAQEPEQLEQPADAYLAQVAPPPSAISLAAAVAAEQRDEQQARTPKAQAPEAPDLPAALQVSAHLAQATGPSLEIPTAGRSADALEDAVDAREPLSTSLADEHDRPAAVPADPDSWEEIERSMRELRIQLEQDLEAENRVAEARQARVDRGERPFTELELRDGYDPDGPSGLRPPRAPPADTAPQSLAAGEQEDRPQPQRKNITGDPDVDELLYAIDCKDELAIEQALKRVANSPYSQALAKQGHEFLDAQAMQEAQEQASTRQALNMDVSTEVQTSRGPVMVMTLPQFANGPAMQGPQGDGGGGGDGVGGGGGGAGGGG
ncbi:hypothetical protein [Xanthomonas hortorum]|uniref:hypothetical protein n=1 Tax=Xanthomonas hortorum TaxID=56454 RepID=UPI003D2F7B86